MMEFRVLDERYHEEGLDANTYYACDDPDDAVAVANEAGVAFVVVRVDHDTGFPTIIFDARFNAELPLAP
jgi:hypothetical protein